MQALNPSGSGGNMGGQGNGISPAQMALMGDSSDMTNMLMFNSASGGSSGANTIGSNPLMWEFMADNPLYMMMNKNNQNSGKTFFFCKF